MNDPTRCPLCNGMNQCGMTNGESGRCWCADTVIASEVLASIPDGARDKACICKACAERSTSEQSDEKNH